jgi:hypothetical protein
MASRADSVRLAVAPCERVLSVLPAELLTYVGAEIVTADAGCRLRIQRRPPPLGGARPIITTTGPPTAARQALR